MNENRSKLQSKVTTSICLYLYCFKNIKQNASKLKSKDVIFSLQVSPKKKYQKMGLHDQLSMCLYIELVYFLVYKQNIRMLNYLDVG